MIRVFGYFSFSVTPVIFAGFTAAFFATAFNDGQEFFSESVRRQAAGVVRVSAPPFVIVVVVSGGVAALGVNRRPVAVEAIPALPLCLRPFAILFRKRSQT